MVIAALIAATCFAQKAEVRTWTRKDGSTVCEGTFAKVYTDPKSGSECVKIIKSTGGETGPQLKLLSEADQAYVKQMATEPAAE
jgi:hypothetical protein